MAQKCEKCLGNVRNVSEFSEMSRKCEKGGKKPKVTGRARPPLSTTTLRSPTGSSSTHLKRPSANVDSFVLLHGLLVVPFRRGVALCSTVQSLPASQVCKAPRSWELIQPNTVSDSLHLQFPGILDRGLVHWQPYRVAGSQVRTHNTHTAHTHTHTHVPPLLNYLLLPVCLIGCSFVCLFVRLFVCLFVCVRLFTLTHLHKHTNTHTHARVFVVSNTHTHTHTRARTDTQLLNS
jgi:hypothetical protein